MKKSIKFIAALVLCSTIFASCTNTDSNEDVQLYQNQETFMNGMGNTGDSGGDDNPPIPPVDPGDD